MANVGKTGVIKYTENFATINLGTGLAGIPAGSITSGQGTDTYGLGWIQNICTGNTAFARTFSATKGLHWAGSLDATDNDRVEIMSDQLMFYAQAGFIAVDCLLQLDNAGSMEVAFGFNSTNTGSASTLPVELNTTTWASTGSTFVGLVDDFDATNFEWHCFWVDDDVDTTESLANLRMQGASLVADKWCYLRVELQDRGSGNGARATFHVEQDGKTFEKVFNTTVDRDAGLCWYLGIQNKSATARGVFVTAPGWEYSIPD